MIFGLPDGLDKIGFDSVLGSDVEDGSGDDRMEDVKARDSVNRHWVYSVSARDNRMSELFASL